MITLKIEMVIAIIKCLPCYDIHPGDGQLLRARPDFQAEVQTAANQHRELHEQ